MGKQQNLSQTRQKYSEDFARIATLHENVDCKNEDVLWNIWQLLEWNSSVRRFNTIGAIGRKIDLGKVAVSMARAKLHL